MVKAAAREVKVPVPVDKGRPGGLIVAHADDRAALVAAYLDAPEPIA